MYIEFTGCSGSGKSTISERVIAVLHSRGHRVLSVHSSHFSVLGPAFEALRNPTLQNLLLDVHGVQHCVISSEAREFLRFAANLLRVHADSTLRRLNLRRSVTRKLGIHSLMTSRRRSDAFRVVDEGIVHSAHTLLVHANSIPSEGEIRAFAARVPLPDVIICVRASLETVIARCLRRRRGWWPKSRSSEAGLSRYLEHGCSIFDKVMATPRIAERTIYFDSVGDQPTAVNKLVEEMVERIGKVAGHA